MEPGLGGKPEGGGSTRSSSSNCVTGPARKQQPWDAFAKELLSGITHFVVSHFADEASDPYQIAHSEDVQNVHELDSATLKMA